MWSIYLTLSVLLIYMLFLPAEAKTRCTDLTIPVTVTVPSFTLSFPQFQNSYQAISFVQQVVKRDISSNPVALGPNRTKTFSISAQYCTPTSQRNSKTLQILSHGLGFDKRYSCELYTLTKRDLMTGIADIAQLLGLQPRLW